MGFRGWQVRLDEVSYKETKSETIIDKSRELDVARGDILVRKVCSCYQLL